MSGVCRSFPVPAAAGHGYRLDALYRRALTTRPLTRCLATGPRHRPTDIWPTDICQHDPMAAQGDARGTWVVDLDGVIWLAENPIPGSADAVARLRQAGHGVVFATNNSSPTIAELQQRLADAGIEAEPGELVTSAQAAASMLEPGSTAVVCADGGVARGARGPRGHDRGRGSRRRGGGGVDT